MTDAAPACLLCGGRGAVAHRGAADLQQGATGIWDVRFCEGCGLAWLDPKPAAEEVPGLYRGGGYYTHVEALNPASRCVSLLKRLPPGRVLDVGCGNGADLLRLRRRGWDAVGLEPDPEAAALAGRLSGAKVVAGTLEDAAFEAGSFDAIMMNHTIEHLWDPVRTLGACRRLLKPAGRLAVATPNWNSRGHARFGTDWFGLDSPRHLFLFTSASLRKAVERAGFAVERLRSTPHWAVSIYINSWVIRECGRLPRGPRLGVAPIRLAGALVKGWGFRLAEMASPRSRDDGEELELLARPS
jgi:SAM-dependent methyltransferase